MAQSPLIRAGASLPRQPRSAALTTRRFWTGIFTNRSPFLGPGEGSQTRYFEEFMGSRTDIISDGANVELSNRGTLIRRPGYTPYSTAKLPSPAIGFYAWRRLDGTITLLADTATAVYSITPTGNSSIFSKSSGAGFTTFAGVGALLYMANGKDAKKWDGTTVSNLGIAAPATAPTLSFTSGGQSPVTGWQYVYCYKSSSDGSVSTASPYSANTGPLKDQAVNMSGDYSPDPQVTTIQIYRTLDGGANYYLLIEIANVVGSGTWSYSDTLPDTELNEFIQAPLNGANNPPPAGAINLAYHMGRLWCSAGNNVYYAGGPDVLNGNPNTAWSPLNYFSFATAVTRTDASGSGLLVQTVDDLQVIAGSDSSTFYAQQLLAGIGLRSRHAMCPTGSDFYMLTSDRQFVDMNPSGGVSQIGFPIADQIANIDPTQAYVTYYANGTDQAVYLADPASGVIWRLNPQQPPNPGPAWSPKQVIQGGFTCAGGVEVSPGQHALLLGQSDGTILQRNLSSTTDSGTEYGSCYVTIGSIVLASPGQLAEVESISTEMVGRGVAPDISVLLDEISGTFEPLPETVPDPPQLAPSVSVLSNRSYLNQGAEPVVLRHMKLEMDFDAPMLQNANFDDGNVGWAVGGGVSIIAGSGYEGSPYLAQFTGGTIAATNLKKIVCAPGDTVSVIAYGYGALLTAEQASVRINFYGNDGEYISTVTGNDVKSASSWEPSSVSGTAPANTTYATVDFAVFSLTAGTFQAGGFAASVQNELLSYTIYGAVSLE